MVLAALALCRPGEASAGTTVSLFTSLAGNINFVTTGGTFRTRANDGTGTNPACQVSTTSSGAISGIPTGSTVVAAYLYYAASGNTVDTAVTLNGNNVTADRTFTDTTVEAFYGGFKDVTSLVTAANTTYTLTNLSISTGNPWCGDETVLGGWSLVIIYSNNSESNRVINVYDGFEVFQNDSITLNPANFKVPATGINGKFAVVTWEGDPTLSGGETLSFNGTVLTDNCNGTNNQYNSTINTLRCTGNATNDDVFYGVDIDTFDLSSLLTSGETSATTFYESGQDAVVLAAQVISISNVPVSDLSITKSDGATNVVAGTNTTYTLTATNHGPAATSGTTTVTDTLPAGETYVSATGTGWSCANVSGTVTCTRSDSIANGASYPPISLVVTVTALAPSPVANTAAVSGGNFDNVAGNSSASDSDTVTKPNYSTSTKTWADLNGGDVEPGDVVEYTVTIKDTAGIAGTGIEMTDDIPAGISGFSLVSKPVGSTDASTGSGTGANGDGFLDIKGIDVTASGTATVVFDVTVSAAAAAGDTIDNTATILGSSGAADPAATTITVSQSSVPATGNKVLYVYDETGGNANEHISRVPIAAVSSNTVSVGGGATDSFPLTPVVATGKTLTLSAGTITVQLWVQATGNSTGTNRPTTVELRKTSGTIATSASVNVNVTRTFRPYNITLAAPVTLNAGDALTLVFHNNIGQNNRTVDISQKTTNSTCTQVGGTAQCSNITFATPTVINVDSVSVYSVPYAGTTTQSIWEPNTVVYIRAVVSDPFGCADVNTAALILTDPNGTVQLNGVNMTEPTADATGCTSTPTRATRTFEYYVAGTTGYTIANTAAEGFWTPSVTASEGTEGAVTHTANSSFEVRRPSLLVMKSVNLLSDTLGDAKPRALSGSVALYTIVVSNTGKGRANGVALTDPIPADSGFVVGSPAFTDGSTASGLAAPTVSYDNASCAGGFTYTPVGGAGAVDANVKCIKATFTPATFMNGQTGASPPSFNLVFKTQVN